MYRFIALILLCCSAFTYAQAPRLDRPLPALQIADRGELVMQGEEFSYRPWRSDVAPGVVHVLQYFPATMGDSKMFRPLTDSLQENLEQGSFHVTTILNLDEALWGTGSFVMSEVKSSKREHPGSTMVLDEEGLGRDTWELGRKGAVLAILDRQGLVRSLSRGELSEQEVAEKVALVRSLQGDSLANAGPRSR